MTTIPIFLHLQPVLAPLVIPEPPLRLETSDSASTDQPTPDSKPKPKAKHLHFVLTLHDTAHNLRFTTVSQSVPGDWLDVEYDQSEWVEERLVDVIRVGVEIIAQDVSPVLTSLPHPVHPVGSVSDLDLVCGHEDGFEAICKDRDTASDAEARGYENGTHLNEHRDGREEG